MNVLVVNPGSASLKFDLIVMDTPREPVVRGRKLVSGVVEPIGGPAKLFLFEQGKAIPQEEVSAADDSRLQVLVIPSEEV